MLVFWLILFRLWVVWFGFNFLNSKLLGFGCWLAVLDFRWFVGFVFRLVSGFDLVCWLLCIFVGGVVRFARLLCYLNIGVGCLNFGLPEILVCLYLGLSGFRVCCRFWFGFWFCACVCLCLWVWRYSFVFCLGFSFLFVCSWCYSGAGWHSCSFLFALACVLGWV